MRYLHPETKEEINFDVLSLYELEQLRGLAVAAFESNKTRIREMSRLFREQGIPDERHHRARLAATMQQALVNRLCLEIKERNRGEHQKSKKSRQLRSIHQAMEDVLDERTFKQVMARYSELIESPDRQTA